LRRELRSAERFSDAAIIFGSVSLKTPRLRSSASLCSVTRCDQRFEEVLLAEVFLRTEPAFRADFLAGLFRVVLRAILRSAIINSLFEPK
jgi:hypothetical protein